MPGNAPRMDRGVLGILLLVAADLMFAIGFGFVKACHGQVAMGHLLVVRASIFLVLLLPFALKNPRLLAGTRRGALAARAIFGTLMIGSLVAALAMLPLGTATLLGKTTPLWAVLLAWGLFGAAAGAAEIAAIALALAGLWLVFHPSGNHALHSLPTVGLVAATAAGLFNACEMISLKRLHGENVNVINLWYGSTLLLAGLLSSLVGGPWPHDLTLWACAVMFGVTSLVGQTLLAMSLHHLSPTAASTGALMVPIFSVIIGWIWFTDVMAPIELTGLALVIVGGTVVSRLEASRADIGSTFRWEQSSPSGR